MAIPRKRLDCAAGLPASVTAAPAGSSAVMEPLETRLLLAGVPTLAAGVVVPNVTPGADDNPAPDVVDWDEDGDKDFLLGDEDNTAGVGYVWRYLNGGTDTAPTYTFGSRVQAGGVNITTGRT